MRARAHVSSAGRPKIISWSPIIVFNSSLLILRRKYRLFRFIHLLLRILYLVRSLKYSPYGTPLHSCSPIPILTTPRGPRLNTTVLSQSHSSIDVSFITVEFQDAAHKIPGIIEVERVMNTVKDYVEKGDAWV